MEGGVRAGSHPWLIVFGRRPKETACGRLHPRPFMPVAPNGKRTLSLLTPKGQVSPEVFVDSTHVIVLDGRLSDRVGPAEPGACGYAELVLRAFLREGSSAFAKFRGAFAVVIWDRLGDSVVCAHDALGAFPLFYARVGDELLVSPFQDVLVAQARVPKSLNALALAEWILNSISDVGDTFFASIRRLPPAYGLQFGREMRLERYWHPEDDPVSVPANGAEVHAMFDRLLVQAVDRCLFLPRTSVLLSGGVDSSVVAAVAATQTRVHGTAAPLALSAAFPDRQSNEVATQRAVAAALGLEHVLLPVRASGLEGLLLPILQAAGESPLPTTTPWEAVYNQLAAAARERGCRSVLTGDGGNELLEARWELAADLLRRGDLPALRTLYRVGRSYYGATRRRMFWRVAWRSGIRIVLRDWLGAQVGSSRPDLVSAWYRRRYLKVIHPSLVPDDALRMDVVERMLELHPAPRFGPGYPALRRRLYDDPGTPLGLEARFAWGRYVGLETLSPLIDIDLIRFLYHTPPAFLSLGNRAKGLAQTSLERRVGTARLPRLRAAFFETFFRDVLVNEGRHALTTLGGAPILSGLGIVDERAVEIAIREGFSSGNIDYTDVWAVLGLEAWLQART